MYNPSVHTATNKPIGLTNKPVDARTYYYDSVAFAYRPYASTSEVIGYLIGDNRVGQFSMIVGTDEYWFKNGIADADLILKDSSGVLEMSYAIPAGEPILQFIPNTGGFDELARLIVIDTVTNLRADITTPTLHYDGVSGNFDGWDVSLPVQDDGNFNTANPCVVWVKE